MTPKKPKPNEPCHCGSGKKYKKCCKVADDTSPSKPSRTPTRPSPQSRPQNARASADSRAEARSRPRRDQRRVASADQMSNMPTTRLENRPSTVPFWMPPPLFGLPPIRDYWGLTDMSALGINESKIDHFQRLAARAQSPEEAEKTIYLLCAGGAEKEAMEFPWLFPSGTGHFAQKRRVDVRFEDYVRHMLRLRSGAFLRDQKWLQFAVKIAAVLRYCTGLPPIYKEEQDRGETRFEMDDSQIQMLKNFREELPELSFCYRYLVGDDEFCALATLCLHKFGND